MVKLSYLDMLPKKGRPEYSSAELAPNYWGVVLILGPRARLITDDPPVQWILQRNLNIKGPERWTSVRFFRFRASIETQYLHAFRSPELYVFDDALERIRQLPERFTEFSGEKKAAAQETSHTTAALIKRYDMGVGLRTQHFCDDGGTSNE